MDLSIHSTAGEVLMYHPLREHYDDVVLNPRNGRWCSRFSDNSTLVAQDNVIMRRHIKKCFPSVAKIISINRMTYDQLHNLIEKNRVDDFSHLVYRPTVTK